MDLFSFEGAYLGMYLKWNHIIWYKTNKKVETEIFQMGKQTAHKGETLAAKAEVLSLIPRDF